MAVLADPSRDGDEAGARQLKLRSIATMHASKLEKSILDWIAARQPALAPRLAALEIVNREHTGVGLYVYLRQGSAAPRDTMPVDGPVIESESLEFGGGCVLWLSAGAPWCLEVYAFGDSFPTHLEEFTLSDQAGQPSMS